MKRIMMTVAYDGTDYCGWQLQPGRITVEGVINEALSQMLKEDIQVIGASRTDAGVHSRGNVCVFDSSRSIAPENVARALNARLPDTVVITGACEVAPDFHPRKCDCVKTYEYRILNCAIDDPMRTRYCLHVERPLDVEKMKQAASHFIGEHDFTSFCSPQTNAISKIRTVYETEIMCYNASVSGVSDAREIVIRVTGNGFLYNMVRIIAGTLIAVGQGRISPDVISAMIEARDRRAAGPTAPAKGLTQVGIRYSSLDTPAKT